MIFTFRTVLLSWADAGARPVRALAELWARTHLHREVLREVSRCRHAALDRMLHRPTETYAGDPEHCRELDDSPDEPGVANAWDSSAERGAFGGAPSRGA